MKEPQPYSVSLSEVSQTPGNISPGVVVYLSTGARDLCCSEKCDRVEAPHHPPACLGTVSQRDLNPVLCSRGKQHFKKSLPVAERQCDYSVRSS